MNIMGFNLYQRFQKEQGLTYIQVLLSIFLLLSFAQESLLFDLSLSLNARLKPKKPFYVNCNTWLIQHEKPKGFGSSSVYLNWKEINFLVGVHLYQLILLRQINPVSYSCGILCADHAEMEEMHESRRGAKLCLLPCIKHGPARGTALIPTRAS